MAAKAIIVLLAFPVLAHAIFTAVTIVLGLLLPTLLPMAGSWAEWVRKGAIGATVLVSLRGSFGVCRRLWPTPAIKPS
jgi:hypothetical protein